MNFAGTSSLRSCPKISRDVRRKSDPPSWAAVIVDARGDLAALRVSGLFFAGSGSGGGWFVTTKGLFGSERYDRANLKSRINTTMKSKRVLDRIMSFGMMVAGLFLSNPVDAQSIDISPRALGTAAIPNLSSAQVVDIDFDGVSEVICRSPEGSFATDIVAVSDIAGPSGTIVSTSLISVGQISAAGGILQFQFGRFGPNGEGGILVLPTTNGAPSAGWYLSLASAPGTFGSPAAVGISDSRLLVVDFDGDGRDDLLATSGTATGPVTAYLNTGGAFTAVAQYPIGVEQWSRGDFNGDAIDDVFVFAPQGGHRVITGAPYSTSVPQLSAPFGGLFPAIAGGAQLTVGDLDNDGADELIVLGNSVVVTPGQPTTLSSIAYSVVFQALPVASGGIAPAVPFFVSGPIILDANSGIGEYAATIVDFDRDGASDLLISRGQFASNNPTSFARVYRNNGNSQPFASGQFIWPVLTDRPLSCAYRVIWGDFDGDGDVDGFVNLGACGGATSPNLAFLENSTVYGTPCYANGAAPRLEIGNAALSSGAYGISIVGAAPNALAFIPIASSPTLPTGGCGLLVDISTLILVNGTVFSTVTDAIGGFALSADLSAFPALAGLSVYAQAAVIDPLGSFAVGPFSFSMSRGRSITFTP